MENELKNNVLDSVLAFAQECNYAKEHSHQVAKISLKLFDELVSLHQLGAPERDLLYYAALLHDIGWVGGRKEHHKRSRDMIIASELPLTDEQKILIGLMARYHRRTLPQDDHKYYADLPPEQKRLVRLLASILRMADGFDRSHASVVEDVRCSVFPAKVSLAFKPAQLPELELKAGKQKADLFEAVFGRDVVLE